jgi:hypothetical protein
MCCCCFCSKCFCCCQNKLEINEIKTKKEIQDINDKLEKIKKDKRYNPLYIIIFKNKIEYENVYKNYPHSYLKNLLCNLCKKRTSFYVNKAPKPEDILWKNLEFDKEYKYFKNKIFNFGIIFGFIAISFSIQIFQEFLLSKLIKIIEKYIGNKFDRLITILLNIGFSFLLNLLDDFFFTKINDLLTNKSNFWSYSETKFY